LTHLWIGPEIADQDDLVDRSSHVTNSPRKSLLYRPLPAVSAAEDALSSLSTAWGSLTFVPVLFHRVHLASWDFPRHVLCL